MIQAVQVGQGAAAVALDSTLGHAFIANQDSNTVSMLDVRGGSIVRTLLLATGIAIVPFALSAMGVLNFGQALNWTSFLAALVAGLAFLAVLGGRDSALGVARSL